MNFLCEFDWWCFSCFFNWSFSEWLLSVVAGSKHLCLWLMDRFWTFLVGLLSSSWRHLLSWLPTFIKHNLLEWSKWFLTFSPSIFRRRCIDQKPASPEKVKYQIVGDKAFLLQDPVDISNQAVCCDTWCLLMRVVDIILMMWLFFLIMVHIIIILRNLAIFNLHAGSHLVFPGQQLVKSCAEPGTWNCFTFPHLTFTFYSFMLKSSIHYLAEKLSADLTHFLGSLWRRSSSLPWAPPGLFCDKIIFVSNCPTPHHINHLLTIIPIKLPSSTWRGGTGTVRQEWTPSPA